MRLRRRRWLYFLYFLPAFSVHASHAAHSPRTFEFDQICRGARARDARHSERCENVRALCATRIYGDRVRLTDTHYVGSCRAACAACATSITCASSAVLLPASLRRRRPSTSTTITASVSCRPRVLSLLLCVRCVPSSCSGVGLACRRHHIRCLIMAVDAQQELLPRVSGRCRRALRA